MTIWNLLRLVKLHSSLLCPLLYISSFGNNGWVKIDTIEWGLWNWCYTNFTEHQKPEEHVNDTRRCHSISPGDSPGYYEAVRTVACFALVAFIGLFLTTDENKNLGVGTRPVAVTFAAASLATVALAVLGTQYQNDERWKDLGPSLGWCFWLTTAAAIISLLLSLIHWAMLKKKRRESSRPRARPTASAAAVSPASPSGQAQAAQSVAAVSISSAANSGKSAAFRNSSNNPHQPGDPGRQPGRGRPNGRERNVSAEFPVLAPPPYELYPVEGVGPPHSPPPSYEEAVREESTLPPSTQTPVVTLTDRDEQQRF